MGDNYLSLNGFTKMVDTLLVSEEDQPDFETENAMKSSSSFYFSKLLYIV